jgi:hypothetical protein
MRGNPMPAGHISLVDENDRNLLAKPGTARYVIISHGPSGSGAWTHDGQQRPCPEHSLAAKNCENNGAFVMAPFSAARGEGFFDNIVMHDDVNAGGTLLDRIANCARGLMFYEPGEHDADRDGCVRYGEATGAWHGICLKSGDPNAKDKVKAVLLPAIEQGGECGCAQGLGLSVRLAGSWLSAPELDGFPPSNMMTSLYTCVRE